MKLLVDEVVGGWVVGRLVVLGGLNKLIVSMNRFV